MLEFKDGVVWPERLAQLVPRYDLLRMFEQQNEYSKGLIGKTEGFPPFRRSSPERRSSSKPSKRMELWGKGTSDIHAPGKCG